MYRELSSGQTFVMKYFERRSCTGMPYIITLPIIIFEVLMGDVYLSCMCLYILLSSLYINIYI